MKKGISYFAAALLFNSVIATLLSVFTGHFWAEFIYSQCIGLSVFCLTTLAVYVIPSGVLRWAALGLAIPVSVALGMSLAFSVSGVGSWNGRYVINTLVLGLFFSMIGVITFLLIERIDAEVKQRQLIKTESEKREIEANLKLLQAQIEPHFLFNTLANVGGLIDSDPQLARQLLDRLNEWLRVALQRTRSKHATLNDELDMLENYLEILKIRFGERLRWHIDVTEEARSADFPPMLLQPLVENAVRHGIEPKIGGGEIGIHAKADGAALLIEVRDNGVGLTGNVEGGAGMANVRARLLALFGDAGKLTLESPAGGGLVARMEFPR